jgi:hypothetical protein
MEKMKTFMHFSLDAPDFESLRRTSQAIIKREPPLLVDSQSVGHCLRQFLEWCIAIPIPHNCETRFVYDLGNGWSLQHHWQGLTTLADVSTHLRGYLHLTVSPHHSGDPFSVYVEPRTRTLISIAKGCYVTPYAHAIFIRNRAMIDGLLMDATWKIIWSCVSSILMLSITNVGIPAALTIGPK